MTAWISRIKLTNFKSYKSAEFNFPQPAEEDGNLVLIGALNGHGKTTLLEAMFLGLYGERSIDVLKRAVHYTEEKDLLPNALSIAAKDDWHKKLQEYKSAGKPIYVHRESQLNIQILIAISYIDQEKENTVSVSRIWGFKFDDKYRDFTLQANSAENRFEHVVNGIKTPIEEDKFLEIISAYIPHYDHARFFLFDGEKLSDIGDKNRFILSGLNDLIGITLLDNPVEGKKGIKQVLEDRLDAISKENKKNQKASQELTSKLKEKQKIDDDIDCKHKNLHDIDEKLHQRQQEQDRLTNILGGSDAKSTQELVQERGEKERHRSELENNIQDALKGLSLYLLPKKAIDAFGQKIKSEFERIRLENNRKRIEPNLKKFIAKFRSEFEQQKGQREAKILDLWKTQIEESLKTAWHSLFYPLPDHAAEYVRHNYLSETNHQDIATTIDIRKTRGLPKIDQWLRQSEQFSKRLTEIDEELRQADIEQRDDYLQQLGKIRDQINELHHEKGALENQIDRLTDQKNSIEQEVASIRKNLGEENNDVEKLGRLIDAIDLLKHRLLKQKQDDLQENTLKIYQQISHDKRVRSVYITAEKVEFLDDKKNEVDAFSAGEKQLQLMALTLALSKTTGFAAPMLIDTPLARLDVINRDALLDYLSDLPQQVILLTQSGEIDRAKCDELLAEDKAQKTFIVESEDFETGRVATVSEDYYFE